MKKTSRPFILFCMTIFLLGGCVSAGLQVKGYSALRSKDYNTAVSCYKEILMNNPENFAALKGIGEAYVGLKDGPAAVVALEKAHELNRSDRGTILSLGLAYTLTEEYGKAIDSWKIYTLQEPDSYITAQINKYFTVLLYRQASRWAQQAVRQEKSRIMAAPDPATVAVTYFGNTGITDRILPLQKAIAAMIITDLSKVDSITVVERIKIQKLLEEMQLGQSGLVDPATAPRLGRLLGAGTIVTGNMAGLTEDLMRIDSVMTTVINGKEEKQDAQGLVDEFFKLEKAVVFGILKDFGIQLTAQEQSQISVYATKSYEAIKYYGEGLDAQDRGDWDEAIRLFNLSSNADPAGPGALALASAPTAAQATSDVETIAADISAAVDTQTAEQEAAGRGGSSHSDGGHSDSGNSGDSGGGGDR